ncbi:fluoride efflux transporter CrcB [Aurantimonas sp. HBX-1]|uniref:fluoride efflux transporter CrcB n=1 Tax=Aurantimonas sp. HBX-1 TaxID=2906072 RepID=UPI001F44BE19|nr:fluoride efflux transporter CrcB [Aurantimonas sp. HBX-1]UIJ73696.1 fluoride efflux transporter CrcB [Aurantimonas sp. HBX-1]
MTENLGLTIGLVAAGSAAGGMARFFVSGLVARTAGEMFPWGTMVVNVSGAFAIGLIAALAQHHLVFAQPQAWALAVTGFLGSYTTVSSFSLQTLALARSGHRRRAVANVGVSLLLCLTAAASGLLVAQPLLAAVTQ